MGPEKTSFRRRIDIQVLRGLAVVYVVLYHARFLYSQGGYLGVDIFFVISGFVITQKILFEKENKSFKLSEFYFARAKRLLPAAYVVFLLTAFAAVFLLTQHEFTHLLRQLRNSIFFVGNQSSEFGNYFDQSGLPNPLQHTWSLSLEEQVYLLLPWALIFRPSRSTFSLIAMIALASLGYRIFTEPTQPTEAYFSLLSRAWEPALGALLAFQANLDSVRLKKIATSLFWPGLLMVLAIPIWLPFQTYEVFNVCLICVATSILILNQNDFLNSRFFARTLGAIGSISYSLYLVHWPLLVLVGSVWSYEVPGLAKLTAVASAFFLSYGLYRFIEKPFRLASNRIVWWKLASLALGSAFVFGVTFWLKPFHMREDIDKFALKNISLYGENDLPNENFQARFFGNEKAEPEMVVWGDSLAIALGPTLAASDPDLRVAVAAKPRCAPVLNLSQMEVSNRSVYNRQWAQGCVRFNQSVLEYIEKTKSIQFVVLTSMYFDLSKENKYLLAHENRTDVATLDSWAAIELIKATFEKLRTEKRKLIIVAPLPIARFNTARCFEKLQRGMFGIGFPEGCRIPMEQYHENKWGYALLFDNLRKSENLQVLDLGDEFSNGQGIEVAPEGVLAYIDNVHLSIEGAQWLGKKVHLADKIRQMAN